MDLNDLVCRKCEWLRGDGPRSDIVMSTRVRLARNLDGHPFFNWAKDEQREEVLNKVISVFGNDNVMKGASLIRIKDITEIDREFLVERHLMSQDHTLEVDHKALVVDDAEMISIMINEEDHLRMQILRSGLNIMEAWRIIDELDTRIGEAIKLSYSRRFGYLTACPTNTGTGLRASVMLHLPALEITGQIGKVYDAISKLGLTIRGFYGEGSEAAGNFFQISNQVALGHSEIDILNNLDKVINKTIVREEQTRAYLMEKKQKETQDGICRSYGTLKSARIITSRETIKLLSAVRLGVDLGIISDIDTASLNEILLLMQPAHLQKINSGPLDPHERDIKRADMVREKIGGGN